MKLTLFIIAISFFSLIGFSQAPSIQWQQGLKGTATDIAYSVRQTTDGGYFTVGSTCSSDADFTETHGQYDGWVSKLDTNGAVQWKKVLGGSSFEHLFSGIQVSDGGYIIVGQTDSNDGDVSGFHTSSDPGATDGWVIKLNSLGDIEWQKPIGGTGSDYAQCVLETPNGFIIGGGTTDAPFSPYSPDTYDYWIINMDMNGNIIWEKTYGGSGDDRLLSMTKTVDGGFAINGISKSADGNVGQHTGSSLMNNYWIIKIGATGALKWSSVFAPGISLYFPPIIETADKGFVIGCIAGNNLGVMHGPSIIKTDSTGSLQWQKVYENSAWNQWTYFNAIIEDVNGDYIVCGSTTTYSGNIIPGTNVMDHDYDDEDAWIMRIDSGANGTVKWKKTYGGSRDEMFFDIQKTSDNGFIVAGSASSTDFDVTTNGTDTTLNVWVVKLKPSTIAIEEPAIPNALSVYPNPATTTVTIVFKNNTENTAYRILNSIGQIVVSGQFVKDINQLNIENLASGMYLLQINGDSPQYVKLVKN